MYLDSFTFETEIVCVIFRVGSLSRA